MIALESAGDVVPRCCNHGILALEVLNDLVACRLLFGTKVLLWLVSKSRGNNNNTNKKAHYNLIIVQADGKQQMDVPFGPRRHHRSQQA